MRTYARPDRLAPGMLLWLECEELRCKLACRLYRVLRNHRAEVEILASDGALVTVDINSLVEEMRP